MATGNLTVKDALNDYFKLKDKFERDNNNKKKKIMNNYSLSNKEKRNEYLKLMPKCINCDRPSNKGTIFTTKYFPEDDNNDSYRILSATCGFITEPCNLKIEIRLEKYDKIDDLMNGIRKDINDTKNIIIKDKNNLLFGLISTETAIETLETKNKYIQTLTSLFGIYLDKWNNLIENPQEKNEMDNALLQAYENITNIKECIRKMNEENNVRYANDAAQIYANVLQPLLNKIRELKYKTNYVYNDNDICKLIQQPYSIYDLLICNNDDEVLSYDTGLNTSKINNSNVKKNKKKQNEQVGGIEIKNENIEDYGNTYLDDVDVPTDTLPDEDNINISKNKEFTINIKPINNNF